MWLLFHRNVKTRPVRDGDRFVETCPECGERATFVEVEVSENFGLFFVLDVVGDKERAYKCSACGETFDLKDTAPPPAAAKPAPAPKSAPAKPSIDKVRIEDELAELKKRMGR